MSPVVLLHMIAGGWLGHSDTTTVTLYSTVPYHAAAGWLALGAPEVVFVVYSYPKVEWSVPRVHGVLYLNNILRAVWEQMRGGNSGLSPDR